MSFGERAVLQGILSELKPRVSLEIGTAQGGSTRWIARHSRRTHTIDLNHDGSMIDARVSYHTGASQDVLPSFGDHSLLKRIDFVLIDGDHTPDCVHTDLSLILDSAACAHAVILLHDTANEGVREGIARTDLDHHPAVVYHELDFVPGYTFARGPFAGEQWGGLGLIVAGDKDCDGYAGSPAQTLYR
jgi:predicted O-methyltransferase YrrM